MTITTTQAKTITYLTTRTTSALLIITSLLVLGYGTITTLITFPEQKEMFLLWFASAVVLYFAGSALRVVSRNVNRRRKN